MLRSFLSRLKLLERVFWEKIFHWWEHLTGHKISYLTFRHDALTIADDGRDDDDGVVC